MKQTYLENNVIFKVTDEQPFTGICQNIRRNGHLVYEEYVKNGFIEKSIVYFNRTQEPVPAIITTYYLRTNKKSKEEYHYLKKDKTDYIHFDLNGKKTLVEEFENGSLVYSCQYKNNKRHGLEFCIKEDGRKLQFQYENGKKIKKN